MSQEQSRTLKDIRNCGAKSVREIMERLFLFQNQSLPGEGKDYKTGGAA